MKLTVYEAKISNSLFQCQPNTLQTFHPPPVTLLVKLTQLSKNSDVKPSKHFLVLEQMPQETFPRKGTLD